MIMRTMAAAMKAISTMVMMVLIGMIIVTCPTLSSSGMETNLRKFSMSVALPIISCLHLGQMHEFKPSLEIYAVRDRDSNF